MPPDEGDALYDAAIEAAAGGARRCRCSRSARTAGVRRCGSAPRRASAARWSTPSTTTTAARRTRPAGSTTTRPWSTRAPGGWTRCRRSGATIDDAGLEDVVVGVVGRSATVAGALAHPAGAAVHRRRPRRRAGPRRLPRLDAARRRWAARWRSTTCSPIRPTAAARRTRRSTCRRWTAGASRPAPRPRQPARAHQGGLTATSVRGGGGQYADRRCRARRRRRRCRTRKTIAGWPSDAPGRVIVIVVDGRRPRRRRDRPRRSRHRHRRRAPGGTPPPPRPPSIWSRLSPRTWAILVAVAVVAVVVLVGTRDQPGLVGRRHHDQDRRGGEHAAVVARRGATATPSWRHARSARSGPSPPTSPSRSRSARPRATPRR